MTAFFGQPRGSWARAVPLAVDRRHAAEKLGFLDQLVVAMEVPRVAAALVADLEELARLLLGLDHLPGLGQIVGHLLLAVDVQAGFHAGDGMLGVPEVGRRDDHRVDLALLLVEHLFVIGVGVALLSVAAQQVGHALLVVGFPDVADGLELDVRNLAAGFHQDLSLGPGPEQGDVDVIAPAAGRREHPRGKGQARPDRRRGTQEAASDLSRIVFLARSLYLFLLQKLNVTFAIVVV